MGITTYRNTNRQWYYNPSTRKFANWLSSYMSGRQYKYSVYQQIFNMFSNETEQMNNALIRHLFNQFPQTFLLDTMDVIHTFDIDGGVNKIEYNNGNTWIEIKKTEYTNPEDWWYKSVPTRLSMISNATMINPVINAQPLQKKYDIHSYLEHTSSLYINLSSNNGIFINNVLDENIAPTKITIYGFNENDKYIKEDFIFAFPNYYKSLTKWKYIDFIESEYYDIPTKFTLSILPYLDLNNTYIKDQVIQEEDVNKQLHTISWTYNNNILSKHQLGATSNLDYNVGFVESDLLNTYKLYFKNDLNAWETLGSVDSWLPSDNISNLIYFIKDNYLLAYHKYEEYPSVIKDATLLKTADPIVNLDIDIQEGYLTIKGIYTKLATNKKIDAFRFLIYKSDGTKLYCDSPSYKESKEINNNWITFNDDSLWTQYPISVATIGFLSPTIQYGDGSPFDTDLIIKLDIKTKNGNIETDTFVVGKQIKYPIYQLPLPDLGEGMVGPFILSFDDKDTLCLNTSTNQMKLRFHNDTFLVDSTGKRIILAEKYTSLRKTQNGNISSVVSTPFNVVNNLDQYGAMLSLNRYLGEKNDTYIKRINQHMSTNSDSSRQGLVNGISNELGFLISDVLHIEHSNPFILLVETEAASHEVDNGLAVLNLFDFETIGDVYNWLLTAGLDTVNVLNPSMLALPARCLNIKSNIKYYYNLQYNKKRKIIPNLAKYEYLYDAEIEGFTNIGHIDDPSIVDTQPPNSFAIIDYTYIVTNTDLKLENIVWIKTITNMMRLTASPIIVSSLHAGIDYHFTFENNEYKVSKYAQILMSESDKMYPNKWSS